MRVGQLAQTSSELPHSRCAALRCRAAAAVAPLSQANRLTAAFQAAQSRSQCVRGSLLRFASRAVSRTALIPFIVAGDPDLATTAKALLALDAARRAVARPPSRGSHPHPQAGADIIELGVPYSDPLADGPVIQAAATRALAAGASLDAVLALIADISPRLRAPLIVFTYFNPILRRGTAKFVAQLSACGASGLLIPDIPLEETAEARALCSAAGLELVLLATPTTSDERMAKIADATSGFVYLVSVTGVTGVQESVAARVQGLVARLKAVTSKPVAVGFGISKPEQAAQLAAWGADGVIVGSALVRALGEAASPAEGLAQMTELISALRASLPSKNVWEQFAGLFAAKR